MAVPIFVDADAGFRPKSPPAPAGATPAEPTRATPPDHDHPTPAAMAAATDATEPPTMRAAAMPAPLVAASYAGSTLITAGGVLLAQGDGLGNSAAVQTGVGAIILGVLSFAAPHITQYLKDWREERRKGFRQQIRGLQSQIDALTAQLARANHMIGVYAAVTAENRGIILDIYRAGKLDRLPDGFMRREFDTGFGGSAAASGIDFEALAARSPEPKVIEVIEGRRAMPTPDPAAGRPSGDRE